MNRIDLGCAKGASSSLPTKAPSTVAETAISSQHSLRAPEANSVRRSYNATRCRASLFVSVPRAWDARRHCRNGYRYDVMLRQRSVAVRGVGALAHTARRLCLYSNSRPPQSRRLDGLRILAVLEPSWQRVRIPGRTTFWRHCPRTNGHAGFRCSNRWTCRSARCCTSPAWP